MSSPAPCSPRSPPVAALSSIAATAIGARFPEAFPTVYALCQQGRHRSVARADPGRAGRALSHGRHRHRRARPHQRCRPVGCRRGRLDRPARRQPARLQLAARSGGVRRPRRCRHRSLAEPPTGARIALRPTGSPPFANATRCGEVAAAAPQDHDRACGRRSRCRRLAQGPGRDPFRCDGSRRDAHLKAKATAAELVAGTALLRKESRGGHFRAMLRKPIRPRPTGVSPTLRHYGRR